MTDEHTPPLEPGLAGGRGCLPILLLSLVSWAVVLGSAWAILHYLGGCL